MDIGKIITFLPLWLKGEVTLEQEEALKVWLEESDENRQLFREWCSLYFRVGYLRHWDKIDWREGVKVCRTRRSQMRFRKLGYWFSGIAAMCLLSVGLLSRLRSPEQVEIGMEIAETVKIGEKKAVLTLADGRKVELDSKKVVMDLGHVTAEGDSLSGLVYHSVRDSLKEESEYNTLSVPRGGEYILTLSDGTRVWLNSETEMTYPVAFSGDKREVSVIGEAFFVVKKERERPFVVRTQQTRTTVLGTAFNVMAYEGKQQTEITLVQGCVAVSAGGKDCRIEPGQQVSVDNVSLQMEKHDVNVAYFISWKEGLFDFDCMKLSELCEKLGRWYDVDFFFENPGLGDKRFTGAVKENNSLQFMLDFVEKTAGVHFEVKGKTIRVYD